MTVTMPTFRPATLDDAELAADLMTSAYPAMAQDPVVTSYRWEHPREGWAIGRFIAELDRRPIAYLGWRHAPWEQRPEHLCEVDVWLDQDALGPVRVPPTYAYACTYRPPHLSLMLLSLRKRFDLLVDDAHVHGLFKRYSGDLAEIGKGEILEWQATR